MLTIYKYELKYLREVHMIPGKAEFLHLEPQGDNLCMWWLVDDQAPEVEVEVLMIGTGADASEAVDAKYLGTTQMNTSSIPIVLHIFAK
jgi:hypothetical protein